VRGPCPGLNTLANHGFINRSGRKLTLPEVLEGSLAGLSIGPDFTLAIFAAGLLASPNPVGGTFDLDDLALHNFPIEHDVSLSRQDAGLGNQRVFNSGVFEEFISSFGDAKYTNIQSAAKAKIKRFNTQKANNPDLIYGIREFILSYGETGLYLQTMGNDTISGVTNIDYIRSLFEREQLPYDLGWRPNPQPVTLFSLGAMILPLAASSGEAVPEGLTLAADSYKDLFGPLATVENVLGGGAKKPQGARFS
ncbi:Cloroperoxidase, partial [Pseudovirgaria hyperparasitica]